MTFLHIFSWSPDADDNSGVADHDHQQWDQDSYTKYNSVISQLLYSDTKLPEHDGPVRVIESCAGPCGEEVFINMDIL